ncbi:MAG TPA: DUF2628 domain-containing protein, partial [Pseudolabrys sp.]|nr:DUF2628 domain-containing protein [Pseudolabrys sp.]
YTVHEPRLRKNESAPDPVRFVFVRDGFYFWAFVLAPLWLLVHRLWLVLVLYLIVDTLVGVGLYFAGASAAVKFAVGFLIALLVGFEAGTLWRWTLARRKWKTLGTVIGEDRELAERRFFAAWQRPETKDAGSAASPPPAQPQNVAPARRDPPVSDIIGLFPEPENPR